MGEAGQALNRYPGGGEIRKRKRKVYLVECLKELQNSAKSAVCCSWTSSSYFSLATRSYWTSHAVLADKETADLLNYNTTRVLNTPPPRYCLPGTSRIAIAFSEVFYGILACSKR
jgi:hypothetical protein